MEKDPGPLSGEIFYSSGLMKIKVVRKKLGRQKALGQAWKDEKLVEIDPRLSPKRALEVLIHEVVHCVHPEMPEDAVDRTGMIVGNILWKEGYRKTDL